jgi:hypothetical protein
MLIKDKTDIDRVIKTSKATSYELLQTHLQNAEGSFLVPLLGRDTYQALIDYNISDNPRYTSPSRDKLEPPIAQEEDNGDLLDGEDSQQPSDNDIKKAHALALWHAQHALIHLAYYLGFDALSAYVSDGGFRRMESDTIKSLFKYQEDNLKRYFHETGMNSLDNLLAILEEHIAVFDSFKGVLDKLKSQIFPDTGTFQKHYHIGSSRIVFLRLKQHIKTTEELQIAPVIGEGNYITIIAELKKEEPDAKVVTLLPYLRDPLAYLSTAMLMEESGAEITERGLYFSGLQGSVQNNSVFLPSSEARIKELVARNRRTGQAYLSRLLKQMGQDGQWEGDFSRRGLHSRDNTGKKTFWT